MPILCQNLNGDDVTRNGAILLSLLKTTMLGLLNPDYTFNLLIVVVNISDGNPPFG